MDDRDVIEAFIDGEPVEPASLTSALSRADARDHLVEILILRDLISGQPLSHAGGARLAGPGRGWFRWVPAAAVVALIGGITGYVAGIRSHAPVRPAATVMTVPTPAPAPTKVIQLRNGIDWTERSGGR